MPQTNNNVKNIQLDDDQLAAFNAIKDNPKQNFFIQGQAGTGKSTLINYIRRELEREVAVVAPTGIAAELIGGSTIHSMFKLGGRPYFPDAVYQNYSKYEDVVSLISTLIIDEASMLRADVFDTINYLCQKAKNNSDLIFGGIQIILVGDLYQLPPVYKYDEENDEKSALEYMKKKYGVWDPFFFDAKCFEDGDFETIHLLNSHRQHDNDCLFNDLKNISVLNTMANNSSVEDSIKRLNKRIDSDAKYSDVPIVTCTNADALEINKNKLDMLPGIPRTYSGRFDGDYYKADKVEGPRLTSTDRKKIVERRKERVVVPAELVLKEGAKVMLCRNDADGSRYVNGTLAVVAKLGANCVTVRLDDGKEVEITPVEWKEQEYVNSGNKEEPLVLKTIGTYRQYPLKLAYAITIHKSQGQTWDDICIDLGEKGAFASGQTYVALSRVKQMKGIHLVRELTINDVKVNPRIRDFLENGRRTKNYNIAPNERTKTAMVEFWGDFDKNIKYPKFATCAVREINGSDVSCFWFTIKKIRLNYDLFLIACSRNKSALFKIPANTLSADHFRLNLHIKTGDVRKFDREYRANNVDIFMENAPEFIEKYAGLVSFEKFLVATESMYEEAKPYRREREV